MCDEPGVLSCCLHAGAFQSEDVTGSQVSDEVEIECSHATSGFELAVPCAMNLKATTFLEWIRRIGGGGGGRPPPPPPPPPSFFPLFLFFCSSGALWTRAPGRPRWPPP